MLSRLARSRRVIFVEEPILDKTRKANLELIYIDDYLLLVRPHTPIDSPGFSAEQMPILKKLLCEFFADQGLDKCVAWFCTPLALPLLTELPHDLVVYDCMDTLDVSSNASPLLKIREQELLEKANFVFTCAPSLIACQKDRQLPVHCFHSGLEQNQARCVGSCEGGIVDLESQRIEKYEVSAFRSWNNTVNAVLNLIEAAIFDRWQDNVSSKMWTKSWKLKKNIFL